MSIRFHCGHCGKLIKAPDSAGGRRGKCPACDGVNFVPAPPEEAEALPLAPLDEAEERRMHAEEEALFAQDQAILAETANVETEPRLSQMDTDDVNGEDMHHLVVNYCLDMFAGNLERAATEVDKLNQHPGPNRQAVRDFLDGKVTEPALAKIPPKVLEGFLKALRKKVR